jgi:hypothetical protein
LFELGENEVLSTPLIILKKHVLRNLIGFEHPTLRDFLIASISAPPKMSFFVVSFRRFASLRLRGTKQEAIQNKGK